MGREYHKEAIGLAKLLFTVASAAAASLIAWIVQNRSAEQVPFVFAGMIGAIVLGIFAIVMLGWAWSSLNELKEESHDENRVDDRRALGGNAPSDADRGRTRPSETS